MTDDDLRAGPVTGLCAQVYFSPLLDSGRVLRSARAVLELPGWQRVVLLGYRQRGASARESRGAGIEVVRLGRGPFRQLRGKVARAVGFLWWANATRRYLRALEPDLVVAHSLAAMAVCASFGRRPGVRLIYDAHELETERAGWPRWLRRAAGVVERRVIRDASAVLVVNDTIGRIYTERYGPLPLSVVRNVPDERHWQTRDRTFLRQLIGAHPGERIAIYQGRLAPGRGLDLLLEAFLTRPAGWRLVLMGHGHWRARLAARIDGAPQIHLLPPAAPEDLARYTCGADLGLCLIEDVCASYRYSLPNKLFEYLFAGIPVLASDLPVIRETVARLGIGRTIPLDRQALIAALDDPALLGAGEASRSVLDAHGWTAEKAILQRAIVAPG